MGALGLEIVAGEIDRFQARSRFTSTTLAGI
jgi:hypothetical protein